MYTLDIAVYSIVRYLVVALFHKKKKKKNIVESGVKHHKHHTPILQKQTGEIKIRINI